MSLGLESSEFDKGLGKSRRSLSQAEKDFKARGDRIEKIGRSVGQSLKLLVGLEAVNGLTDVARAMKQAVVSGLEYASSLGEQAQQLGVTSAALQEYRYAATQVGVSQEEMDTALAKLSKTIGMAAEGSKAQVSVFKSLGIAVKDTKGNILDAGSAIPKIADALSKITSPAQRAAIEVALFGRAGQKLDTLLSGGSAAVNALRDAAHKLGVVLSEDQIQRADDTADKLSALKMVLQARIAGAVSDNANAILTFADSLGTLVQRAAQAFNALRKFRLQMAAFSDNITANSPLVSQATRNAAAQRRDDANLMVARLDGKVDTKGGFRDYSITGLGGGRTRAADAALGDGIDTSKPAKIKTPRGARGSSGPSASEIEGRFNDQLVGYTQQILSARESMAMSAQEEAEIQERGLKFAQLRTLAGIKAEKDFSAVQKQRLTQEVERLGEVELARINFQKQERLESEATAVAQQNNDAAQERLQLASQLADTEGERQRIALEQLELEEQSKRDALERILSSSVRTDAEKALAQLALDELNAGAGGRRAAVARGTQTYAQGFLADLKKSPEQINEAIDRIKIQGLDALNDGLAAAITGTQKLGDVFKSVATGIIADLLRIELRKAIIAPLAKLLNIGASAQIGGDTANLEGNFDKVFSKIPKHASGTMSAPGGLSLVGERGPEIVNLKRGAQVISNHDLRGMGGGAAIQVIPSPYFDVRVMENIGAASDGIARAGGEMGFAKVARAGRRSLSR